MKYYIDTSIYLNLWQKEIETDGLKLWKFAEEFLQKMENENHLIIYSGFILKELFFILKESYPKKRLLFGNKKRFKRIFADGEDYEKARELERKFKYKISFFDCMHVVLSVKEKATLITRDKKLINLAREYCDAGKPEDYL